MGEVAGALATLLLSEDGLVEVEVDESIERWRERFFARTLFRPFSIFAFRYSINYSRATYLHSY